MERARKERIVAELRGAFNEAGMVVVTRQNGLKVADATELRRSMRDAGATFRVTKNRLALRALAGTPYEGLRDLFAGPTAVAVSADPLAAARAAVAYAGKNDGLVVIGGAMGETMLDADGVGRLASLPSLDELRARLVGLLRAPAAKTIGVLRAPAGQVARVFSAYADTDTGADG